MRSQVDLMIEGVPSHIWTWDTAVDLLGSSCLVDSLAPETANQEDLLLFKLRAWCIDPDEPELVGNPVARRPSSCQLLEYKTLIHSGRVREHAGPEGWLRPPSSDGSDQSGLSEDSGIFSGSAGGALGGSYRQALLGHVGPSNWHIPPMPMRVTDAPPQPQPECSTPPVTREAILALTAVANPTRSVGPLSIEDPGQGDVPTVELAPTVRLELVVVGAVCALSPALDQELPPIASNEDKSADSVLEESVNPEDGARGCQKATEGIGQEVPEISEETGQVLVPVNAQSHVPRDEWLVGATVQEGELALGWAPVEEISSGAPLHAVPIGCMDVPRLVEHAGCMDVDIPMHAHAGLLLPPKEQIVVANIKAFYTGLLKKLAPPLLKEIDALRGKCVAQDTPCRNMRSSSACAPRKTSVTKAKSVLLKALGITPDGLAVTDEALGQLRQMFDSPI
ncbi:hypothetical protein VPH35_081741 [Triticum aestivum]